MKSAHDQGLISNGKKVKGKKSKVTLLFKSRSFCWLQQALEIGRMPVDSLPECTVPTERPWYTYYDALRHHKA